MSVSNNNDVKIMLEFFAYKHPPYWSRERKENSRSRLTVPNCKISNINWNCIKLLFGDKSKSHDKGNLIAEADLSNGKTLKAWVNNKRDGEILMERMASLSEAGLIYPFRYIHKNEYDPNNKIQFKEKRPQYLAYMHILRSLGTKTSKTATGVKKKRRKSTRIEFHYDAKPSWMDDKIRKLLE
ncbi:MAG: hypothetical protein F6K17_04605 [Okeania sp. SIO3C4]|nr:hypothetical protein [Okeania sp. SIO3B3]NER01967.1 hypothetical protein [Okeania sp. SIO3C4]